MNRSHKLSSFAKLIVVYFLFGLFFGCSSGPSLDNNQSDGQGALTVINENRVTYLDIDDVLEPFDSLPLNSPDNADKESVYWDKFETSDKSTLPMSGKSVERGISLYALGCNLVQVPNAVKKCLTKKVNTFHMKTQDTILRIQNDAIKNQNTALRNAKRQADVLLAQVKLKRDKANARKVQYQQQLHRLHLRLIERGKKPKVIQLKRLRSISMAAEELNWESVLQPYEDVIVGNVANNSLATERGLSAHIDLYGCRLTQSPASIKKCIDNKITEYRKAADKQIKNARERARRKLNKKLAEARKLANNSLNRVRIELRKINTLIAEYKVQIGQLKKQLDGTTREQQLADQWDEWTNKEKVQQEKNVKWAFDFFDTIKKNPRNISESQRTWRNGYLLSLLSWIVYADEGKVEQCTELWGLTLDHPIIVERTRYFFDPQRGEKTGSTQAMVVYNKDVVIVAFQGSTTKDFAQDWIDNDLDILPFSLDSWGSGTVLHHGFYEAMEIAYPSVISRIRPLLNGRRKLWLTGHSLGGAVAFLTAYKLKHEAGIDVHGVHVFGAPPVGNQIWSKNYNRLLGAKTKRWNLERDPVPVLYMRPAFWHVGKANNLYARGGQQLGVNNGFTYRPSLSLVKDLNYVHMNYWYRLHKDIRRLDKKAASLPTPPPAVW